MRCIRRYVAIFVAFYFSVIFLLVARYHSKPASTNFQLFPYDQLAVGSSIFNSLFSPMRRSVENVENQSRSLSIVGDKGRFLPLDSYPYSTPVASDDADADGGKIILMWSGSEDVDRKNLGGCPDYNCRITNDRRSIDRSSAVVFMHGAAGELPSKRYPWQYYVFFTQESPMHAHATQPYKHFFNLTLSYRRDSDAPSPYGFAVSRSKSSTNWKANLTSIIAGKTKLVSWFVSNCDAPSRRDSYVRELKKWIPVDTYGSCGTKTCSRQFSPPSSRKNRPWSYHDDEDDDFENDKDDCDRMLERDYKFYLAFENSVCKDYATEKFWQKLTLRVVVVVLKRSILEKYAPPNSFIAADDFRSPRDLASYLLRLNEDPSAYERRFDWRHRYRPVFLNGRLHDVRERPWGFCTLCSIISRNRTQFETKSYEDVNDWWERGAECDNDLVIRLLKPSNASATPT